MKIYTFIFSIVSFFVYGSHASFEIRQKNGILLKGRKLSLPFYRNREVN